MGQGGLGDHGAVCAHVAWRVAWCRGEGEDAAADVGREFAALRTLEGVTSCKAAHFWAGAEGVRDYGYYAAIGLDTECKVKYPKSLLKPLSTVYHQW